MSTKKIFGAIFAFLWLTSKAGWGADVKDFQARTYTSPKKTIVYRLFIPKNYQPTQKYPLMLTLHGAGERGNDNTSQLFHDFNKMWADDSIQTKHPCFVLAPQCPLNNQWVDTDWGKGTYDMNSVPISDDLQAVVEILDSLGKEFSLDPDRIYVSGISMGGYGTWYMILKFPDRFAAAIPVCGAGDNKKAASISKVPIWAFHAADDGTVPVAGSRDMVNALKPVSSVVKYTEYPASMGIGHGSWVPAGKTPELPSWLFNQAKVTVTSAPKSETPISGSRIENSQLGSARVDALGRVPKPGETHLPGDLYFGRDQRGQDR